MTTPVATAVEPTSPALVRLGGTNLMVSRLGLGMAGIGRPAYMTLGRDEDLGADRSIDAMQHRCLELLDAAYAAGIRYVDTARSYGLAEQFLSAWWTTRGLPNGAVVIGSKWGYTYTGAWRLDAEAHEIKQLSVHMLRRQASESFAILGGRLSLYQIHSATIASGVLADRTVLTELMRLREQGLCIGLTVTGPRQTEVIRRALDILVDGVGLFQTVQATWNPLEPSAAGALAEAHARGCGILVKEALANGRLTERSGGPEIAELRAHAARRAIPVETLVMAMALAQPWVDVVISGAVTREQLASHIAALDVHGLEPLASIAEPVDLYWSRREGLPWS